MKKAMLEKTVFTAVALVLIGGLVLFGCSRSAKETEENIPHEQSGDHGHDHEAHAH